MSGGAEWRQVSVLRQLTRAYLRRFRPRGTWGYWDFPCARTGTSGSRPGSIARVAEKIAHLLLLVGYHFSGNEPETVPTARQHWLHRLAECQLVLNSLHTVC